MSVRVLIEMDDGGRGVRAVNVLDSAMRAYNEKLRRADPSAEIDFQVLGVVSEEPEREYGRLIGDAPYQWLLGSSDHASATHWRTKAVPAGPWLPVEREGEPDA